jgi:protein-S-isoprenylcysteine O-methyltransferase Ste14
VIIPTLPNAILLLLLGGVFIHFMHAGAKTFYFKNADNEPGAWVAQFSFLITGSIATWWLGILIPIPVVNQVAAWPVFIASIALYEWARRTITGRRFGLALSDQVPEALCNEGPYRFVRHPIYLSYVLAFLAVLIALPHWITGLSFLFNLVLSIFAARSDERVLAASPLAADYAAYRERTGMFLPKFSRPAPGR